MTWTISLAVSVFLVKEKKFKATAPINFNICKIFQSLLYIKWWAWAFEHLVWAFKGFSSSTLFTKACLLLFCTRFEVDLFFRLLLNSINNGHKKNSVIGIKLYYIIAFYSNSRLLHVFSSDVKYYGVMHYSAVVASLLSCWSILAFVPPFQHHYMMTEYHYLSVLLPLYHVRDV